MIKRIISALRVLAGKEYAQPFENRNMGSSMKQREKRDGIHLL